MSLFNRIKNEESEGAAAAAESAHRKRIMIALEALRNNISSDRLQAMYDRAQQLSPQQSLPTEEFFSRTRSTRKMQEGLSAEAKAAWQPINDLVAKANQFNRKIGLLGRKTKWENIGAAVDFPKLIEVMKQLEAKSLTP